MSSNSPRFETQTDIKLVIMRVDTWDKTLRFKNPQSPTLSIDDILHIPSIQRCSEAFRTEAGRVALKEARTEPKDFFAKYGRLTSAFLPLLYQGVKAQTDSVMSSLPRRLAQTIFELNLLNDCGDTPSERLLKMVGDADVEVFKHVQEKVGNDAFKRLQKLASHAEGGLERIAEKYSSSAGHESFLNEVFTAATGPYAMEILNSLEFAGYDLDDPAIVHNTVAARMPA